MLILLKDFGVCLVGSYTKKNPEARVFSADTKWRFRNYVWLISLFHVSDCVLIYSQLRARIILFLGYVIATVLHPRATFSLYVLKQKESLDMHMDVLLVFSAI